jgi:subtilisin family serine protease
MLSLSRLAWLSGFLVCVGACSESPHAVIASELVAALDRGEDADVIVNLREPTAGDRAERKANIAQLTAQVRSNLADTLQVSHEYHHVSAIAGRITPLALELLRRDPNVSYVQLAGGIRGQLTEAVSALGIDRVQSMFKLRGRGVRIAVLDSGIDHEHPDLQGAVAAEHCFARGACAPWNLAEGTDASDQHGHGTSVAGVIASRGVVGPRGIAPEAQLVVVKVMNAENRGNEADFLAAIDWLYDNMDELKVSALNLSIGTDALFENATDCDRGAPAWARAIRNLVEAGVTVIAGTGNLGSTTQLPAPACNTGVIAVGATYDADVGAQPSTGTFETEIGPTFADCRDGTTQLGQITCYTNTPARLDVLAPGGPMVTTHLGGDTFTASGTSYAAAAASGVAALLYECNPSLRPAELLSALVATGQPKLDSRSGNSFPFVRGPEAVVAACPSLETDAGTPQMPTENPAGAAGSTPLAPTAGSGDAAGSGSTTVPSRDSSKLERRYSSPKPATPLDSRPVRAPSVVPSGKPRSAADGGETDDARRTERVSSCSVGTLGGNNSRGLVWLFALAILLRRRRR